MPPVRSQFRAIAFAIAAGLHVAVAHGQAAPQASTPQPPSTTLPAGETSALSGNPAPTLTLPPLDGPSSAGPQSRPAGDSLRAEQLRRQPEAYRGPGPSILIGIGTANAALWSQLHSSFPCNQYQRPTRCRNGAAPLAVLAGLGVAMAGAGLYWKLWRASESRPIRRELRAHQARSRKRTAQAQLGLTPGGLRLDARF